MKSTEVEEELGHRDAQELLVSESIARLAYTGLDGFPRVIPVGFYWNGEQVVVCTATTSPKVHALTADGHVALTIDTPSARALLIRGIAALETVDGVADEYLEAAKKSMAGRQLVDFETQVRSVYHQMVRISIRPHWARFYDFGAGRFPRFLGRLIDGAS